MDQRMITDHRPPARRDAARQAFKDLLLEAYREREALLRGKVKLVTESHDAARPDAARAPASRRNEPRHPHQPREAENRHRARPQLRAVESPRAQPLPRMVETPRTRLPPDPLPSDGPHLALEPPRRPTAALPRPEIAAVAKSVAGAVTTKLPAVVARNVVEAFFPSPEKDADHDVALQRLWRRGLVFIAVFGGALSFWLVATTMSSAVIGPGQFVVDGSVKKVQHPTGGVVSQLLVREGDQVAEGDLLIRLDETVMRANYQVVVGQLDELTGRKARLEAEREGHDAIDVPPELSGRSNDPEVARIVAAERKLFQARRSAREGQRSQLTKRITQLQNEIVGLRSQLDANGRESQIITDELKGVRELFAKQLTPIMRLSALERQAVNLTASIAQTEGKIAEIEQQIMQINEDLRAETQKELREVQGKIAELSERRVAADDQLKRVELRAPSSGMVHQLAVHTVGGVVAPVEPVMVIVPSKEDLVVEAKVMPQDRDQLRLGQKVVVRVHSSNQRNTPELNGTLTRIAADVSKDGNAATPFYGVWVTVAKSELARLRNVSITAGMQADVFIEAGSRSPLNYLLRPLTDQASRAFRER